MRQILLLILLFFAGSWIARKLRDAQARAGRDAGPDGGGAAGASRARGGPHALPEPMVRCAECGVHAPKGDAIVAHGATFCSVEHARRYAARVNERGAQ